MTARQHISTRSALKLLVEKVETEGWIDVSLQAEVSAPGSVNSGDINEYLLHWGLRRDSRRQWEIPPRLLWPEGTKAVGQTALQTPFAGKNGQPQIVIRLARPVEFSSIDFALYVPRENRWDNNGGKNYCIDLGRSDVSPAAALEQELPDQTPRFERVYDLDRGSQLATAVISPGNTHRVMLVTNLAGPVLLHWGIARHSSREWILPPPSLQPAGTSIWQDAAAETAFVRRDNGLGYLNLEFEQEQAPLGICFVLRQADTGLWFKDAAGNFFLPVQVPAGQPAAPGQDLPELADEIIRAETGRNSWTLMHRFNLCYDLLDRPAGGATRADQLALLFVWLRFSAIRQLDWQRNYNTKPRELSHAQDRLTLKLADLYAHEPASRPLLRLMMATLGRGGEGQKIRDEILGIMHRHNIKEVAGHFMEEWHQKLHNNTTPDDVVICEAYLAFLRSNGNVITFYNTLQAGGVSKARLESFERPIRSAPAFVPHLKEGLIRDFENFLRTLKAVHSGGDLETAIKAAGSALDDSTRGLLSSLLQHQSDRPPIQLANEIAEARRRLSQQLQAPRGARDLLYLDLALEQLLRTVVERNIHLELTGDQLTELIARVTENLVFSSGAFASGQNGMHAERGTVADLSEIRLCFAHWQRLVETSPRSSRDWALHAKAVLDRLTRSLAALTDSYYRLLQSKAELLGHAFRADPWTITIFSEEVVRGGLAFALSLLVRRLNPILRETAQLGAWQLISRGVANGRVETVEALGSIQGSRFEVPAIIVTEQVRGDEEIPEGVTAVIASAETDILSHVAVRARNANVLFATCYDSQVFQQLKALSGHLLRLEPDAAGDLVFREVEEVTAPPSPIQPAAGVSVRSPEPAAYALGIDQFNENVVGAKSLGQARLQGKLPEWIHQPVSVAVPFGVLERVLALNSNRAVAERYQALASQAPQLTPKVLSELRQTVLELTAPDEMSAELGNVLDRAGISSRARWGDCWEAAWTCIKRVWASKWNERAYFSRRTRGSPDEALFMAVLVQQVIPAEYAFVIHTVNPFTGASGELYAEVVLGLGETLVGNYPGRALSFTCDKSNLRSTLVSYPSKGLGLYSEGLIFRSDSNGEDLAGYAGAGLYDSVVSDPAREVLLDYSQERLVWQESFRNDVLISVSRIGVEIEGVLGSAQDIEGVYSAGKYYVVQSRPQVG